jgi:hypothetical protein
MKENFLTSWINYQQPAFHQRVSKSEVKCLIKQYILKVKVLTSALYRSDWSDSSSGHFTPLTIEEEDEWVPEPLSI